MDEIKSQEQNWVSESLSVIGCEINDSSKWLKAINETSQNNFIISSKHSLTSGINEYVIAMNKIPNSLVNGIQYAEVYNSVPIKSGFDVSKDLTVQTSIPSSLAVDNILFNKSDYRVTINTPISIPNFLKGNELYKNPILDLNSSENNFVNKLSTNTLSTNYISLSKADQQLNSVNDLHSIHKFGLFSNGSLDLITDTNHIVDANLFAAKQNIYYGSADAGFISGSILAKKDTQYYFENILETRLNSFRSEITTYIDSTLINKPTHLNYHQIYYTVNNYSVSDIQDIIDLKLEIFGAKLIEDIRRIIGKELRRFKIEQDKEDLFLDAFDIVPGIGPVVKLGYKAINLINETKTLIL